MSTRMDPRLVSSSFQLAPRRTGARKSTTLGRRSLPESVGQFNIGDMWLTVPPQAHELVPRRKACVDNDVLTK